MNHEGRREYIQDVVSYCAGCAFGRWDIRFTIGSRDVPELGDPFDPLPVSPPGMLVNKIGLPATETPPEYPLRITWSGILVEDTSSQNGSHADELSRRIEEVLEVIWPGKGHAIQQEAAELLSVQNLRDYLSRPSDFFSDHLKRYTMSRRKAPIYWPLSSKNGTYTLWIYYPRLTDQTLFLCINDFLPKRIDEVELDLSRLRPRVAESGSRQERARMEKLEDVLTELSEFREELLRIAELPYKPDLNDGVPITACPLWAFFRLTSWRNYLKKMWEELEEGKYDWAHLAMAIWPDRVEETCKSDRSLAIAHDLEEICEV